MRKIALIGGGLLVALVSLALVLPFVIDLNQFKPQVKRAVSEAVHGEIEFDSIRLTILTGLGVRLTNVKITNTDPKFAGTTLFRVEDLTFRVDLMPLLSKRFEGYLSIDHPEIVVATAGVRNNLAALTKPSVTPAEEEKAVPADAPPPSAEEKAKQEAMIEEFKRNIVIRSVRIDDAQFLLKKIEGKGQEPVRVNDLDVLITDIGLEKDIKAIISTDVDVKESGINLSGPIDLTLNTKVSTTGSKFEVATFSGKLNLDNFAINAMDAFVKKPGVALNTTFAGAARANSFDLDQLVFNLHNLAITAKANINDFQKLKTDAKVEVVNKNLAGLGEVLPQHKDLLVAGSLDLQATVTGLLSDLAQLKVGLDLKTQLTGSDLALKVTVPNAKAPVVRADVTSKRLDLGAILGPFMPKETAEKKPQAPAPKPSSSPSSPPAEAPAKDFVLSQELKELLAPADIQANVNMEEILFNDLQIKKFRISTKLANMLAKLDPLALDIFEGRITMKGDVNLNAAPISFSGSVAMAGVQTQAIIKLIAPEHQELIEGKANVNLTVDGQGTTVPTLSKNLNGKGSFAFLEGQLNTGSVADKMGAQLDSFIAGSSVMKSAEGAFKKAESVLGNPALKKSGVLKGFNLADKKSQFNSASKIQVTDKLAIDSSLKDVKGDIEIKDGKIHITSKKASDAGVMDVNVSVALDSTLGGQAVFLASEKLKSNMLKQSKYASLFFDDSGNLKVPFQLSGLAADPKVAVNTSSIKNNFQGNANKLVEKEVQAELDKLKKGAVGAKLQQAKEMLEQKKSAMQAKIADEKKKQEAAAKEKAKAKLKSKIPGL